MDAQKKWKILKEWKIIIRFLSSYVFDSSKWFFNLENFDAKFLLIPGCHVRQGQFPAKSLSTWASFLEALKR